MRKIHALPILFIFTFSILSFYPSNDPFISKLKGQLEKWGVQFPQEKIYLHTDRDIYAAGENIFFKVYLRDASSMQNSVFSSVAHVELINEEKRVIHENFIFIKEGSGVGDILLKKDLASGNYTLRAYTSFMNNYEESFYFKKNITIAGSIEKNNAIPKPKIEEGVAAGFFPEGGDMVDGIASRIGFKVFDKKTNKGIKVDGRILDNAGKTVAYMKTAKFGLGVFSLTPVAGENYKAAFEHNGKKHSFSLPQIQTSGYTMQVTNRDVDSIAVQISNNSDTGLGNLYIVGQMRGSLFYAGKLSSDKNVVKTYVSKDSLPDGIAQLTIFSESGEPLCERLVFVERPENKMKLKISTDKEIYSTREKVKLNLAVRDATNFDVEGDLSVTVTNSDLAERQEFAENIKSWMLINSDLKGKIEAPGFYFSNNKKSTKYVLDILMMTQGWRRFTWKQLNEKDFPEIKHLPEIGFNIEGYVTNKDGAQRKQSNIYLSVMNEAFKFEEAETDAQGKFLFPNLHLFDTTTIVLQARKPFNDRSGKKKKDDGKLSGSKLLDIHLKNPYLNVEELADGHNNAISKEKAKKNLDQFAKVEDVEKRFDGWSIELTDINVTGKRKPKKDDALETANRTNGIPKFRVEMDSLRITPLTVAQMLQALPGVRVQGPPFQEEIFIVSRGQQVEPVFVLDGTPVNKALIQSLDPSNIHFLDVYDIAPIQYRITTDGGSAAIIIRTRFQSESGIASIKKSDGIIHVIHPGYNKTREFAFPNYDDKTLDPNRPDYRTTLYWNGNIKTDPDDINTFSFFACDQIGSFDVIVEGMTKKGIPVFAKHQISVE